MNKTIDISADSLKRLELPPFRSIDRQFARFLIDRCGADDVTALAGAVTSAILASGHSCLLLGEDYTALWGDEIEEPFQLPPPEKLIARLQASPSVGKAGERKPLILHDRRLYLYKYFSFETKVSERLQLMARSGKADVSTSVIGLATKLFKDEKKDLSAFGGQLQSAGALLPFFTIKSTTRS